MDTDRNLLFAALAHRRGLLTADQLAQALNVWARRRHVPLAELLVEQGWLSPADRTNLERQLAESGAVTPAGQATVAGEEVQRVLAALRDSLAGSVSTEEPLDEAQGPTGSAVPTTPRGSASLMEVQVAGRNRLMEVIGRGGMGAVLRGRDPDLDRDIAVKVLLEEHKGQAELVRRFLDEARINGQLQHPHVVPVHELGWLPDGRPYFTMKLVQGRTLAELLKERADPTQDLPRFLTIFEQICQALAHAHARGIIHRDLKPANVMVGSFGEVQVMDWGLAKVLPRTDAKKESVPESASELEDTPVDWRVVTATEDRSRAGQVVGTPTFMPPEQAKGEIERIDERADVFGLGGILCVILTGQPPYIGRDLLEVYRLATAGAVEAAFARLEACGADAELIQLCKDCLSAERDARPREAGVVAERVAAYQAGVRERLRQAELQRAAAEERALGERKRRRLAVGLAAAVLALVVGGAVGGLWVQRVAAERREEASRQRQAIEAALDKLPGLQKQAHWQEADTVLSEAESRLGTTGPADLRDRVVQARTDLSLARQLDAIRLQRATIVDGKYDLDKAERDYATAFASIGITAGQTNTSEAAARVRDSAIREQLVAALDDWSVMARDPTLRAWLLELARRSDPEEWRDRFRDPQARGDRAALQGLANELLRDEARLLPAQSPQLLAALGYALLWAQGDAVPLLTEARRHFPSDFWINFNLGNALNLAQKREEAAGYYRAALALRPEAVAVYNNLGGMLHKDRPAEAIREYRTALRFDPRNAQVRNNLGLALIAAKQPDQALAEFRQAVELDPQLADAHCHLGLALAEKGQIREAIPILRKAVTLEPRHAKAHSTLGTALATERQFDEAIVEFQKASALDPKDWLTLANLGLAFREQRRWAEARESFRHCLSLLPALAPQRLAVMQQLQECERRLAVQEKLPAFLEGREQPRDNIERLILAQLCLEQHKLYVTAVRHFTEAFAAEAKLADDMNQQYRYNAACAAALAGCGQGQDANQLDSKERARLRQQALDWLKADLAVWSQQATSNNPQARLLAQQTLKHWQSDADFAHVREQAAVEKLPAEERQAWQKLWADVEAVLKQE